MPSTVFERNHPDARVVADSLASTRQSVFWLDELPSRDRRPALVSRERAALAVVGGGFAGLWTALLAKDRDPAARVILLEGRTIGWAASGRNGGFAEASLTHGEKNGTQRYPDELAELDRVALGARSRRPP